MPNCGNRMKKYSNISFHRLPRYDSETLPLWLVVLQVDVQTPFELLRKKEYAANTSRKTTSVQRVTNVTLLYYNNETESGLQTTVFTPDLVAQYTMTSRPYHLHTNNQPSDWPRH